MFFIMKVKNQNPSTHFYTPLGKNGNKTQLMVRYELKRNNRKQKRLKSSVNQTICPNIQSLNILRRSIFEVMMMIRTIKLDVHLTVCSCSCGASFLYTFHPFLSSTYGGGKLHNAVQPLLQIVPIIYESLLLREQAKDKLNFMLN